MSNREAIDTALSRVQVVQNEISRCVVGMHAEINHLLCAILAGRHVLVEGVPGIGKTHLVNTLAKIMGCSFTRIQFTPDLLPADIIGSYVYNPKEQTFDLRRGPVFANFILADEINRAPAKTQSALLEVMQERQVTIEGNTIALDRPFFVFATQNPIEHEGVYPLPQAQLDRFAMRLLPTYPDADDEKRILTVHRQLLPEVERVLDPGSVTELHTCTEQVTVSDEIISLIVELSGRTRSYDEVLVGASPRLSLDLMHLCRARAVLEGRSYVIPDDVKHLLHPVANHRIVLTTQAEIGGITPERILNDALQSTVLV